MTLIRGFKWVLTCFLLISINLTAGAQNDSTTGDTLKNIINATLTNGTAKLFVHYDKTVYLPNEAIWFTAYLLNSDTLADKADVLSVAVVKNSAHNIAVQKKFVVTGATSSGNILIPDTILAGDYSIIAYTNHFEKERPVELFTQHIVIKRIEQPDPKVKPKPVQMAVFTAADSAKISIEFYPEGGDMVANLPGYVGWEAKDGTGKPLKLKSVLLKDNEFIDTVETSVSGMGRFFVNPKPGSKYTVRVTGTNIQSTFNLPSMVDKGVALTVPSAIVHDTLVLKIAGTLAGRVHIVIHNALRVFYILGNIDPQKGRIFKIALDSLPRGLAAITIFNENFQPCAERIFFAHYDKEPALKIVADQAKYGKRKKVVLHLNFNSPISKQGMVSVACVRANRIDGRDFNDIESFAYLDHSVNNQPLLFNNGNLPQFVPYLEDVLLVKGWRRYTTTSAPIDTDFRFSGVVTNNNKPLKKPVILMLFRDSVAEPIATDETGKFYIKNNALIASTGKKLALMATGNNTAKTRINWTDPYERLNRIQAQRLPALVYAIRSNNTSNNQQYPLLEHQIVLNQVTIKSKQEEDYDDGHRRYGTNECGDYVGPCGTLNCPLPGHDRDTYIPVKGHKYHLLRGKPIIYQGCQITNKSTFRFDGIDVRKEFYPYGEENIALSEPMYESTLYWNNQVQLEKNKEATLTFYTGDIKAGFTIIAQGVTDDGVLFCEQQIEIE